ncbi:uncharacterized protein LOC100185197 isoform X2 [Ciona intestinalis]
MSLIAALNNEAQNSDASVDLKPSVSPTLVHNLKSEVATLRQQLGKREMELSELASVHQEVIEQRTMVEGELEVMKKKALEADAKLSEIKAESEAAIRQNANDKQELAMIRRRSLVGGGGGQIITQMYETILMRYEKLNSSHEELRRRIVEECEKKAKLEKQLENARKYDPPIGAERDSLLRQAQIMNEKIESLMRDLTRVREERTMVKREYSLVMSERDAVHKEMDKLQEDLNTKQKQCEQNTKEIQQLTGEKDSLKHQLSAMQPGSSNTLDILNLQQELYAAQRERKQALVEKDAQLREAYNARQAHELAVETVEQISRERDALTTSLERTKQELQDALNEAKESRRWREIAFSERHKLRLELEESKKVCDEVTAEREKLVKQLEEAVKEHDTTKETKNKILSELREIQTRVEMTQRENAHSHDSAIDAGEWESSEHPSTGGAVRLRKFVTVLPHGASVEPGWYVKNCESGSVAPGDRIVAVNNVSVADKTLYEVRQMVAQGNTCYVELNRAFCYESASRDENFNEEIVTQQHQLVSDWTPEPKPPVRKNNAHKLKEEKSPYNGVSTPKRKSKEMILSTEEENLLSHNPFSITGQQHTLAHDSLTTIVTASKKKKFFWRRKKSKSIAGTSSSGGSPGGTWPRLDSPPLSNIISTGARLSVFNKKRNRPSISSTTFTPPSGHSAGHTPPTALRGHASPTSARVPSSPSSPSPPSGSLASNSLPSQREPAHQGHTHFRSATHKPVRRRRPVSAPMGERGLTPWQGNAMNSNNNNTVYPLHGKQQRPPESKTIEPPFPSILSVQPSMTKNDSYLLDQSNSNISNDLILLPSPAERTRVRYNRQQSVPEASHLKTNGTNLSASLTPSISPPSHPGASPRPRSSYSLPRPDPTSYRTALSVSSYTSSDTSRKTRTMDCKRIRIPSEASVGIKLSGSEKGSINLSSDRSTPVLFTHPFTLDSTIVIGASPPTNTDPSVSSLSVASSLSARSRKQKNSKVRRRKTVLVLCRPPVPNDPRYVSMIKGTDPIGISIVSGGENGGIFVSRLTEHSLAAKAGLEYGDQLLEYNGINLRSAKEDQARAIMSQTQPGDMITFLAHYNLEKYKNSIESNLSDTLGISQPKHDIIISTNEERDERTITPDATPRASPHVEQTLQSQTLSEPRFVFMNGGCTHVKLIGGNSLGIYVAAIQSNEDTLTPNTTDLRIGDKILEYNSLRFTNITLEGASIQLAQPVTSSSLRVVYEPSNFERIFKSQLTSEPQGDHFYVRALFDHMVEREGLLRFTRNSILLVDNTYPDYSVGQWLAWLVDEEGQRSKRGRIPSKLVIEKDREILALDDVASYTGSSSGKRLSGSGRRSFFKRRKPHRNSSRSSGDVRLQKSLSETSIESVVESEHLGAYQVVDKHSSASRRPVIVFGPHSSLVIEKLAREHTEMFVKCSTEQMKNDGHGSTIIESYTQSSGTLVLTEDILVRTMKMFPDRHVLLELSVDAVDRLHSLKIYPIIAFVKFSSAKKIKESQDRVIGRDKLSLKQCKEIMDKSNTIERKLVSKYFGTVLVNGGQSTTVAIKVSQIVSHEHTKVLWLPATNNPLNY